MLLQQRHWAEGQRAGEAQPAVCRHVQVGHSQMRCSPVRTRHRACRAPLERLLEFESRSLLGCFIARMPAYASAFVGCAFLVGCYWPRARRTSPNLHFIVRCDLGLPRHLLAAGVGSQLVIALAPSIAALRCNRACFQPKGWQRAIWRHFDSICKHMQGPAARCMAHRCDHTHGEPQAALR